MTYIEGREKIWHDTVWYGIGQHGMILEGVWRESAFACIPIAGLFCTLSVV